MTELNVQKAADIQYHLGITYSASLDGNRQTNLKKALACFQEAK